MPKNLFPVNKNWGRLVVTEAYEFLGAHLCEINGQQGAMFRVWAPNAKLVSVVGDFNGWQTDANKMMPVADGIWELFIPNLKEYDAYKFAVSGADGKTVFKADPFAFHTETSPANASKLFNINNYAWQDEVWLKNRESKNIYQSPVNIYEVHLPSWRRQENGAPLSYTEVALQLADYAADMGYTHIELMPITEYPFDGSWGYQVTGYFALTSRFGNPNDFKNFIDILHSRGIGIILDWVPAHLPKDEFGLYRFDGTHLFEYSNPLKGEHKQWGTAVFDYGRVEVASFLISSAIFWLKEYHIDGLRVDAVASMLYLDYGREAGQWCPNADGGNENLEAVWFLKELSKSVFGFSPSVMLIAEESTAWPMVTKPTYDGGLGFNFKWNMGWMNDMLRFMAIDPIYRKYNHSSITFSFFYAFSENFILPLSHDEVVHGKCSMIGKMFGDYEAKFSSLRTFYAYMMAHPGKKLMFMGQEFAQFDEWRYYEQLDWFLLQFEAHKKMQNFVKALNRFYLNSSAFWQQDFSWQGFSWISHDDVNNSIIAFRRFDLSGDEIIVVCNFVPVKREKYRIGLPFYGEYERIFSTDDKLYGGNGGGLAKIKSETLPMHGLEFSAELIVPSMSCEFYKCTKKLKVPNVAPKVQKGLSGDLRYKKAK